MFVHLHYYSVINDSEDLHRKMRQKPKRGVADVAPCWYVCKFIISSNSASSSKPNLVWLVVSSFQQVDPRDLRTH